MAFCMKCGKEIDDDAAFCRFCGASAVPETVVGDTNVVEETQSEGKSKVKDSTKSGKTKRKLIIGVSACLAAAAVVCGVVIGYLKLNTPDKRIMQALDNTISAECFRIDLKTENMASKEYTSRIVYDNGSSYTIDDVDKNYYNEMSVEIIRNSNNDDEALIYYAVADFEEHLITSDGEYSVSYLYPDNMYSDGEYNYIPDDWVYTKIAYKGSYEYHQAEAKEKNIAEAAKEGNLKDFTDETKVSAWLENNLDMDIDDCKELLPQILKDIGTSGSTPDYVTKFEQDSKEKSYKFTLDLEKFVNALDNDYDVRVSNKMSKKMSSSANELVMEITLTNDNKYLSSVYLEYYNGKKTRSISAKFENINDVEALSRCRDLKEEVMIGFISNRLFNVDMVMTSIPNSFQSDVSNGKISNGNDLVFNVYSPLFEPQEDDYEYMTEYSLAKYLYSQLDAPKKGNLPTGKVTFKMLISNQDTYEWEDADSSTDIESYIKKYGGIKFVAVGWSENDSKVQEIKNNYEAYKNTDDYKTEKNLETANSNAKRAYNAVAEYVADMVDDGYSKQYAIDNIGYKVIDCTGSRPDDDTNILYDSLTGNGVAGYAIVFMTEIDENEQFAVQWRSSMDSDEIGQYPDAITLDYVKENEILWGEYN